MKKLLFSKMGFVVLVLGVLLGTVFSNTFITQIRIDLTEDKLFTLSDGTKNLINETEKSITFKLFYSDTLTKDIPQLRDYAKRVRELLGEYVALSSGRFTLELIDPEPFSEEEDLAAEFGLEGIPLSLAGDEVFFGLAVTDGEGGVETIPFFQQSRETYLEYDISKIIYSFKSASQPVVGLISSLDVLTGNATHQGHGHGGGQQPWTSIKQLEDTFVVKVIEDNFDSLSGVDLLLIVHPQSLTTSQLYLVDQYVLGGGNAVVFVDPRAEHLASAGQLGVPSDSLYSQLDTLFTSWGIRVVPEKILGDYANALQVGDQYGRAQRHVGIYQYGAENFSQDSVMMHALESINIGTAGVIEILEDASTVMTPLIQSSEEAAMLDAKQFEYLVDPSALFKGYQPGGVAYTVAASIQGEVTSAFEGQLSENNPAHVNSGNINVVVVADTDLLTDRMWVSVQQFFGQVVAQPFADNGSFVANTVEAMLGSADLINIRGRGSYAREFTKVAEIQRDAEQRFREEEEILQLKLEDAEQRIFELENQKDGNDQPLVLNKEQQLALEKIRQEKLNTRKELRNVQHQLNKDIESLGTILKLFNILFMPACLMLLAIWVHMRRRR